jgi:hypothetical protein
MVVNETVYNCYGFNLELDDGPIDTFVYASKHLTLKEAKADIKKRFTPNKVTKLKQIEDPFDNTMDEASGIKNKSDLSNTRKRRLGDK